MSERTDVKPLHVELPLREFKALKDAADAEHRTLKGELRRLIQDAYGISQEQQEQTTAATAGAV